MFTTVEQAKQIITQMLNNSGRGGFITGTVSSITPLKIRINQRLELTERNIYITESCIGLTINLNHDHKYIDKHCSGGESGVTSDMVKTEKSLKDNVVLRKPLAIGDGVLLLCRPASEEGSKYILLDRIQPYVNKKEIDGNDT